VLKCFRAGVIVVVLLGLTLSAGVAVADPPNLEDVHQYQDSKVTSDGWRLHVFLDDVAINSVPNMAATAFTREAYVSATATVWVEPLHPDDPAPSWTDVTQRSISLWLQQGCQATLGATTLSLNNSSQAGLQGTATNAGATSITPNASETPNPQYQQALSPGTAVGKNLQNKAYPDNKVLPPQPRKPPWVGPGWTNDTLTVSLQNWDMRIDGCAGPVSFRFIAEATMSTSRSDDGVDAFSAIVQV
jgi:hypothetical protein